MNEILKIKDVHKSFEGNSVHRGLNFSLQKGETLGLLGGSGTGKSVLLRSIIGLEYIDQGEIIYKDSRIDNLNEDQLFKIRTKVSYAFQSGALFDSLTVFENVAYPLIEHTKKSYSEISNLVESTLELVDLKGKSNLMPSDLSGGMQKRVGLARSIILNPDIILYDEPTAGLDPENVENILQIMASLKKKEISSIYVTHDILAAVKICDRIVILDKGVIAFNNTPKFFMESQDPLVEKFKVQIKG
jgi:phospholipid/cholesterol/gamma-HCH transport system ATP-binding protein